MKLRPILYSIILIEGYSVLAVELLAIRLLVPFVGSSVEIIAILVAAVLMPLAIGYYVGGRYQTYSNQKNSRRFISIREKLIRNLVGAILILSFGLSYKILDLFFYILTLLHIQEGILQATIYAILFIVYPIFLLGQTVPLISNYFSEEKLSDATGKMLFFSTLGSFLGSLFSTIVLMSTLGVHNTVIITIAALIVPIFLLSKKRLDINHFWAALALGLVILFNNNAAIKKMGIIENNNYSTISIIDQKSDNAKVLSINRSNSSKYSSNFKARFPYLKYIETTFLKPYAEPGHSKRRILVVGAGGFVIGVDDTYNHYTYVDIDGSLKKVSEDYFLKQPLGENKEFVTASARLFFRNNTQKYDVIILDTYSNAISIPPDLVTEEFFFQVKEALAPGGIMVANIIASPNFNDPYSIRVDNSLDNVFYNLNRHVIHPYQGSKIDQFNYGNIIYSYFNNLDTTGSYSDNKNTYFLDKKAQ